MLKKFLIISFFISNLISSTIDSSTEDSLARELELELERELQKELFGEIQDEEYLVKLYINKKFISDEIKIKIIKLEDTYIYDLNILNHYLVKPIDFKNKTLKRDLPFKSTLDTENERLDLDIEPKFLKPFKFSLKEKELIPNNFLDDDGYFVAPLYFNYLDDELKYSYSFNYYYKNYYMKYSIDKKVFGYKNYEVGDVSTSSYGGISTKLLNGGISYNSKNNKNYTIENDFSKIQIDGDSIAEFYKNGRLIKTKSFTKGNWNLENYKNSNEYVIKILNLSTNEVKIIQSNRKLESVFNYSVSMNKDYIAAGFEYGVDYNDDLLHSELGIIFGKEKKEIGTKISYKDVSLLFNLSRESLENSVNNTFYSSLIFKNLKLKYTNNKENSISNYTDSSYERNGRYVSLDMNIDKLKFNIEKDLNEKKYSYGVSYNDYYDDISYDAFFRKEDNQNTIGLNVSIPLYKQKNTSIKLSQRLLREDDSLTQYTNLDSRFDVSKDFKSSLSIKKDLNENTNDFQGDIKYINKYYNNSIKYQNKKWGGSFNTHIVANTKYVGLTKTKPFENGSVYFLNDDSYIKDVINVNNVKKHFVKTDSLRMNENYIKTDFILDHKENQSGEIKVEKVSNYSFTPDFFVIPFDSFEFHKENNEDEIEKGYIEQNGDIFLENVVPGTYILKLIDRDLKLVITKEMLEV